MKLTPNVSLKGLESSQKYTVSPKCKAEFVTEGIFKRRNSEEKRAREWKLYPGIFNGWSHGLSPHEACHVQSARDTRTSGKVAVTVQRRIQDTDAEISCLLVLVFCSFIFKFRKLNSLIKYKYLGEYFKTCFSLRG